MIDKSRLNIFWSTGDVKDYLGVSYQHVYNLVDRKILNPCITKGSMLFLPREVKTYEQHRQHRAALGDRRIKHKEPVI